MQETDPQKLAFLICWKLHFDIDQKQELLELRNNMTRVKILIKLG